MNSDGTGKWSFLVPDHIVMSPSVANDGTVYFGCDDSNVYAVAPDGRLKWKFQTGGAVRSTPAITKNGTIYFGSLDKRLYAVSAEGELKWAFTTGGQVYSPAIADDGTIYVQNGEAKLYAIQDPEQNGGLAGQWPKRGGGLRNTISRRSPLMSRHRSAARFFVCLLLATLSFVSGCNSSRITGGESPQVKWQFSADDRIVSTPALAEDGTIYFNSPKFLYALSPDGQLKWRYFPGADLNTSPVVGRDDSIYIMDMTCVMHALNPDGSKRWLAQIGPAPLPAVSSNRLVGHPPLPQWLRRISCSSEILAELSSA